MIRIKSIEATAARWKDAEYDMTKGMWAFAFTPDAATDREFAERYAEYIDSHVGDSWHCLSFAEDYGSPIEGSLKRIWRPSPKLHEASQQFRKIFRDGPRSNDFALLFFNPLGQSPDTKCIKIALDLRVISQEDVFKKGLNRTTEAVRVALKESYAYESKIGADQFDLRLDALKSALLEAKLGRVVVASAKFATGPIFGALARDGVSEVGHFLHALFRD